MQWQASFYDLIDAACIALNYKQTKPEFTFHCPHTQPLSQTSPATDRPEEPSSQTSPAADRPEEPSSQTSPATDRPEELKPHTATLNDMKTFLTCDVAHTNSYPLQAGHLVWFGLTKGLLL